MTRENRALPTKRQLERYHKLRKAGFSPSVADDLAVKAYSKKKRKNSHRKTVRKKRRK